MDTKQKAQAALAELKAAVLEEVSKHNGISNNDLARNLNLESDYEGEQKNYLSWSIIGEMLNENTLRYEKQGKRKLYFKA